MHVKVDTDSVIGIGVVALQGKNQYASELGITVKRSDTLDDVLVEHLEGLTGNNNLPPDESWMAVRNFFIENPVQLMGVFERQPEKCDKL